MDQVHVEAPAFSARAVSVEREFYSDFPLILNYVARLMDDIDGAAAVTCAAFRQVADGLRHRPTGEGMQRADVLRVATELSRQSLRPRRWFRRNRALQVTLEGVEEFRELLLRGGLLPSAAVGAAAMDEAFALSIPDRLRTEGGSRTYEIAPAPPVPGAPAPTDLPPPLRPEISTIPDLLTELEREIFRDEPVQDHPTRLSPMAEPLYPAMAEPEEIEPEPEPIQDVAEAEPVAPAPETLPAPLREVPVDSHREAEHAAWAAQPEPDQWEPQPEPVHPEPSRWDDVAAPIAAERAVGPA